MPLNAGDWTTIATDCVGVYLLWQQNQIFKRQNEIFASQAGHPATPSKTSLDTRLKRYWPTVIMVVLILMTGYDIYDRHADGAATNGAVPWWHYGSILLLVAAGTGLMIGRLTRTEAASASAAPTENSKEPSKLRIHSANYRAVQGGGQTYDVSEFLRKIISGDTLAFDVENHNFVIGDKNFVPNDPLFGVVKQLQVTYSYGAEPTITIVRYEHDRLVLPEDSKIQQLTEEIVRLKAAQPKPVQYPVPQLRAKVVAMISELQGFLGAHGQEPDVKRQLPESPETFQQRWRNEVPPWRAKFIGDYRLKFHASIPQLRDEIRLRTGMDNSLLNVAIDMAANDPNANVTAVQAIIKQFWDMALQINA
jgi:hypothetical protein